MKKSIISILCIAITALTAMPQTGAVTRLSLDDCRRMALENNAKVKIAQGNAEAAAEVRREAFTKYFPTVSAQGMAFWSNKPVFHYNVMDLVTIEFLKKGVGASISAIQPVFAGGRIVNGNRLAEVGEQAGRLQVEGARNDVALTAEQYYWQIITLKAKKQTLNAVIGMLDTLEQKVDVTVRAGVINRNDLLKVQLRRNEMKTLMVDLDNGIDLATSLLAQYVGMDGEKIDVVDEEVPGEVPPFPSEIYIEPSGALSSTIDYQLLQKQLKAAELQEKITKGGNLPTVGVGAGYFYDDMLNQKYSFGALFVSVSVPISDWWGGSHAIKKSRIATQNARTEMEDLSQMLKIKMQNAWDDLTAAYRKMQIAKESIEQSAENLRISNNYYNAGMSTITDLLDAQTLYRQSLDEYTEAYGNFRMNQASYLNATGRTEM